MKGGALVLEVFFEDPTKPCLIDGHKGDLLAFAEAIAGRDSIGCVPMTSLSKPSVALHLTIYETTENQLLFTDFDEASKSVIIAAGTTSLELLHKNVDDLARKRSPRYHIHLEPLSVPNDWIAQGSGGLIVSLEDEPCEQ